MEREESKNVDRRIIEFPIPGLDEIEDWVNNGYAFATDGCEVEPDGYCEHGCPSWLIQLGLI